MENWTKAEDLLPLVGDDLLLLLEGDTILRGRRNHNGWSAFFADGEKSTGTIHVSHWMLLPAAPGSEQKHQPKLSREEIAAMAMQALIGNWEASCKICDSDPRYNGENFKEVVAANSAEFADALLSELSKPKQ